MAKQISKNRKVCVKLNFDIIFKSHKIYDLWFDSNLNWFFNEFLLFLLNIKIFFNLKSESKLNKHF